MIPLYPEPYYRGDLGLPEARLENMYMEKTPQGPSPVTAISRPGLGERISIGNGPIRGLFRQAGAGNDGIFAVSGSRFFKGSTKLCNISNISNTSVRWAASDTQVVVVSDNIAYAYEGGITAAEITDSDLPDVADVKQLGNRFYYLKTGTDEIYYSELSDATDIDALSFFNVESMPDSVVGMEVLNGEMVFFGEESIDFYYQTGDPDAPLASGPGRSSRKGCASRDTICAIDNSLAFLGADRQVYFLKGYTPQVISNNGIAERVRECPDLSEANAWTMVHDGHEFYVLNLPEVGTFAYDVSTRLWSKWSSFRRDVFRVRCATMYAGEVWAGDDTTGQLWKLRGDIYRDSTDPIIRVVSCGLGVEGGRPRCSIVRLHASLGVGRATGDYQNPQVEMRFSDDQAETWSPWEARSLGRIGAFDEKPTWRNLGVMESPGRAFEFRCSANVAVALKAVDVNVQWP